VQESAELAKLVTVCTLKLKRQVETAIAEAQKDSKSFGLQERNAVLQHGFTGRRLRNIYHDLILFLLT
jgi:hypothetical protein